MNRRGYFVLLTLLAIAGAIAFFSVRSSLPTPIVVLPVVVSHIDTPSDTSLQPPMVQVVEDRSSTQYVTRDILYPQFVGVDPEFNAKIRDLVVRATAEHASSSAENWQARRETVGQHETVPEFPPEDQKFSFYVTWTPVEISSNIISIVMKYGGFSGAAHGYENIATFNYDLKKKEEVELKDLFLNDSEYLSTISKQAIESLENDLPIKMGTKLDAGMKRSISEGAAAKKENFMNFTFTRNTITIYFSQYQVGPYVIGEPEVMIPRPK